MYRINETNDKIIAVMEEKSYARESAIRLLERQGEELYLGGEFSTYVGMISSITSIFLLYNFARQNDFMWAFSSAFFCFLTSFFGGLLLFYIIFTGKSERKTRKKSVSLKTDWERSIHDKSMDLD